MSNLIQRLNDIWRDDDHERGCAGRNYLCSCGFDERTYETSRLAAEALAAKDAEIERLRDALETISVNMHGSNPSLAYADAPREDYVAHVLWEARQLARVALNPESAK